MGWSFDRSVGTKRYIFINLTMKCLVIDVLNMYIELECFDAIICIKSTTNLFSFFNMLGYNFTTSQVLSMQILVWSGTEIKFGSPQAQNAGTYNWIAS